MASLSPQEILALELELYRTVLKRIRFSSLVVDKCGVSCLHLRMSSLCYAAKLSADERASEEGLRALKIVAKACVVSALQAIPRPRRIELARSILDEHKVILAAWIEEALQPGYTESPGFENEDALLFNGLLHPLTRRKAKKTRKDGR